MSENLAVLAIFAFLFSVVAGRVERSVLAAPMVCVFFGLLVGGSGLGLLELDVGGTELQVLAEVCLALVLFLDAAKADLRVLRRHARIPRRMLLVGLPLCIALGAFVGWLVFPAFSLWEVCILATILATTDAALGKGVAANQAVPRRIRQALSTESGLSDGMLVPVLFVFLALATGQTEQETTEAFALRLVAEEVGIGIAVAVLLVAPAVQLIKLAAARGWFTEVWKQIPVVGLALSCFATAQSLDGGGLIACFVGGLMFGYLARDETHGLVLAGEGMGELLAMLIWVVFGASIMGPYWAQMTWDVVLYSVLSLTLIRILPVVVSLSRTGEPLEGKLFLGWFGPRGLPSIIYMIIVAARKLPAEPVMILTVVCTVTLSVVVHGLTAFPWARRLARTMPEGAGAQPAPVYPE